MLREIKPARQNTHSATRHWFTAADMDVFAWFINQIPIKFQLSAGKRDTESAISWQCEYDLTDSRADNLANFIYARLLKHPHLKSNHSDRDGLATSLLSG